MDNKYSLKLFNHILKLVGWTLKAITPCIPIVVFITQSTELGNFCNVAEVDKYKNITVDLN